MSLYERLKDINIWYKATDGYRSFDEDNLYKYTDYGKVLKIVNDLYQGKYEFGVPKIGKVKKDDGTHREVIILETGDRIVMRAINIALSLECRNLIHPNAVAYKEYSSVSKIIKSSRNKSDWQVKLDIRKYFNSVGYEQVEKLLDRVSSLNQDDIGIVSCIKEFFKDGRVYRNNEIISYSKGLCQGSAVSSFLANALLYSIDKYFSENYNLYYRYSDDILIGGRFNGNVEETNVNIEKTVNTLSSMLSEFGLEINDKKTRIYLNGSYDFLGYSVTGNKITLSNHRIDKIKRKLKALRLERQNRSIKYCRKVQERYIKDVYKYLAKADENYASVLRTVFSTINSISCLVEIDKYFVQQIKTIYTRKSNYTTNQNFTEDSLLPSLGYVSICELYKMYKFNYGKFTEFESTIK